LVLHSLFLDSIPRFVGHPPPFYQPLLAAVFPLLRSFFFIFFRQTLSTRPSMKPHTLSLHIFSGLNHVLCPSHAILKLPLQCNASFLLGKATILKDTFEIPMLKPFNPPSGVKKKSVRYTLAFTTRSRCNEAVPKRPFSYQMMPF